MTKIKKWYSCIPFLTIPIQTRRQRLMNDPDFLEACMAAHIAPDEHMPFTFDRFMKFIVWRGNSRKLNRQIQSDTGRELLRSAHTAGSLGESFESWERGMKR